MKGRLSGVVDQDSLRHQGQEEPFFLRLWESEENHLRSLRESVIAGEASGQSDLSLAEIAAQVKAKHGV